MSTKLTHRESKKHRIDKLNEFMDELQAKLSALDTRFDDQFDFQTLTDLLQFDEWQRSTQYSIGQYVRHFVYDLQPERPARKRFFLIAKCLENHTSSSISFYINQRKWDIVLVLANYDESIGELVFDYNDGSGFYLQSYNSVSDCLSNLDHALNRQADFRFDYHLLQNGPFWSPGNDYSENDQVSVMFPNSDIPGGPSNIILYYTAVCLVPHTSNNSLPSIGQCFLSDLSKWQITYFSHAHNTGTAVVSSIENESELFPTHSFRVYQSGLGTSLKISAVSNSPVSDYILILFVNPFAPSIELEIEQTSLLSFIITHATDSEGNIVTDIESLVSLINTSTESSDILFAESEDSGPFYLTGNTSLQGHAMGVAGPKGSMFFGPDYLYIALKLLNGIDQTSADFRKIPLEAMVISD